MKAERTYTLHTEEDGYQWYEEAEDGYVRICDKHKNVIVDRWFKSADIENGFFVVNNRDFAMGIYLKNGIELVSPVMGYSIVSVYGFGLECGYVSVFNDSGWGVYDIENGREVISPNRGYDHVLVYSYDIERGYFSVEKNELRGVCDLNGKEIISPDRGYDSVYMHERYVIVKKNGLYGVCDLNGVEIVTPKYEEVRYSEANKRHEYKDDSGDWITLNINTSKDRRKGRASVGYGYVKVKKNGLYGVCDLRGVWIIAPKYKDIRYSKTNKWHEYKDDNGKWVAINTNSSEYTKSQKSGNTVVQKEDTTNGLLYKGTYTRSTQGYSLTYGYLQRLGDDRIIEIEIYNDYLIDSEFDNKYDYVKTNNNGYRVYENSGWRITQYYEVNCNTFEVIHYKNISGDKVYYETVKGETSIPTHINNNYNNYNNNYNSYDSGNSSGSYNNPRNKSNQRTTKSKRDCTACRGTGRIYKTDAANPGMGNKWCAECNKTVPGSHYHINCPTCRGSGKVN